MFTVKPRSKQIVDNWVRAAEETAVADEHLGKRQTPRLYPWHESLEIQAGEDEIVAQGRDISHKGAGFTCRRAFHCGDLLGIRRSGENDWVPIIIWHCTSTVGGFKIGALFIHH